MRSSALRRPVVFQVEAADCGAAALAMLLNAVGRDYASGQAADDLRARLGIGRDGCSLADLQRVAADVGVDMQGVRVASVEHLRRLELPAIAHWDGTHFVVIESRTRSRYTLADPAVGRYRAAEDELLSHLSGAVLHRPRSDAGRGARRRPRTRMPREVVRLVVGLRRRSMAAIVASSIVLQLAVVALAAALGMLARPEASLGNVALIFAGLAVGECAVQVGRALAMALMRSDVADALQQRFVDRLIRQPYSYFAGRPATELFHRLDSARQVAEAIISNLLLSGIDALFALVAMVVVLVQRPVGFAIIAAGLVVLRLLGGFAAPRAAEATARSIAVGAAADGYLLQSLRGIETLKGVAAEDSVLDQWTELQRTAARAKRSEFRIEALVNAIQMSTGRAFQALTIGAYALYLSHGGASASEVIAGVTLVGAATVPMASLCRRWVQYHQMSSHLTRISDILDRPVPAPLPHRDAGHHTVGACALVAGVGNSETQPVDFSIAAGSRLAIVGASGAGKTTLLRTMAGLLPARHGGVTVDGEMAASLAHAGLRVSMVPQEPVLFAGTLRQNIALTRPGATDGEIVRACEQACFDADLRHMPLGLATMINADGAGLSGGQRQRIAIARALLAHPDVLLLDEATSGFDEDLERELMRRIAGTTCIIVSHRRSLVTACDAAIEVVRGGDGGDGSEPIAASPVLPPSVHLVTATLDHPPLGVLMPGDTYAYLRQLDSVDVTKR